MKPHLIGAVAVGATAVLITAADIAALESDSAPGDPVPSEFVLDVVQKQDEKIKAGLGG